MRTTKHEFVKGCEDTANMLKALAAFAHDLPEGDVGQVVKLLRTARPALLEIENRPREKLENDHGFLFPQAMRQAAQVAAAVFRRHQGEPHIPVRQARGIRAT
jgi:hypothetical protein